MWGGEENSTTAQIQLVATTIIDCIVTVFFFFFFFFFFSFFNFIYIEREMCHVAQFFNIIFVVRWHFIFVLKMGLFV